MRVGRATKLPGRVIEIILREGNIVAASAIIASFDASEIDASAAGWRTAVRYAVGRCSEWHLVFKDCAVRHVQRCELITGTDLVINE